MFQSRYSPVAVQAEITGKMQPDLHSFKQRKALSGNSECRRLTYDGMDSDGNLSIMPGELVVGRRLKNGTGRSYGSPQETGFSSVAGLYHGNKSIERLNREHYLLGAAKGEYQYQGDNLFGTAPMDHGIGFLRGGSFTINNNSWVDFNAGDLVAWTFPNYGGNPRDQGMGNGARDVDNGLNPRASANRAGTPIGKPLIQVEKFDPSDFSFQLAGAHQLYTTPGSQGGVSDVSIFDLEKEDRNMSTLAEEALGWAAACILIASRGVEFANPNPGAGKVFYDDMIDREGKITDAGKRFLNSVFLRNTIPGSNNNAVGNFTNDYRGLAPNSYEYLVDNMFNLFCGALSGAWNAKASRIIGKAMGNSKSTQMLDLMFSHFKVAA